MSKKEISNTEILWAAEITQFRFAPIAPAIQDLYPDKSRTQYYRRITKKPLTQPDEKDDDAVSRIFQLRKDFSRLNTTHIHLHLIRDAYILATFNVCAVQRFICHNDGKSARGPNIGMPFFIDP